MKLLLFCDAFVPKIAIAYSYNGLDGCNYRLCICILRCHYYNERKGEFDIGSVALFLLAIDILQPFFIAISNIGVAMWNSLEQNHQNTNG